MVLSTSLLSSILNGSLNYLATDITAAAVGDDATPAPTAADTALNNQVFADVIDSVDASISDRRSFTFQIGSGEANGSSIVEVAFKSGSTQRSHDLINSINKTSDIQLFATLTIIGEVVEV